jgi:alkanesulfonate monooxygenase SsuD/methylene tetrahydromethanopterin reductase-like flavin-dependent oxidoreductase (luciferase family)
MRIDLHINQALAPVIDVIDCAIRADRGIYGAVWVLDHLASMEPVRNKGQMLDPHVLLGAIAANTTRVHLGVLVNNVAVRPAEVIAGATASLDLVSRGRAVLGLGAGAAPDTYFASEHAALGNVLDPSMEARHDRLLDTLARVRAIWSAEHDKAVVFPKPTGPIPVVVGVNSVALARRAAATGCGINVRGDHPKVNEILGCADSSLGDWSSSVWFPYDRALTDSNHPRMADLKKRGVTRVILLTASPDDLVAA